MKFFVNKIVVDESQRWPEANQARAKLLLDAIQHYEYGPGHELTSFFCRGSMLDQAPKECVTEPESEGKYFGSAVSASIGPNSCQFCCERFFLIMQMFGLRDPQGLEFLPFVWFSRHSNPSEGIVLSFPLLKVMAEHGFQEAWRIRLAS